MNYSQESFEKWLKDIPAKLKFVTEEFAKENKLKLDFSVESLIVLEKWILKNYDVAADLRDEEDMLDMLALYVGETYIIHIGGAWFVDFDNEKNINYLKIVMKYNGDEDGGVLHRSAKALCTSCISRKRGNLISSTLEKSMAKY